MSNFVNNINGVFTISFDGKEHKNLVVNSGLSSIFKQSSISSLCEVLKVYNDDAEVVGTDTEYLSPVASSANVTDTVYGVTGDGVSDYFYMRRTWTFSRGQITGVINKLAVYSDDGSLYAAALLKDENGELDPVRPLFAPKVEITYESRWHFKQGDSFTTGTPVYFSDAGIVTVKTNMASKNDSTAYSFMNEPFSILDVTLYSDVITSDDSEPSVVRDIVDVEDYSISYIDGQFGAYGQKLNLVLPKDKYISDTPIASMVITTTRGKWQLGFDAPLEKPTLSKREISINVPFIHGTVSATGEVSPTGNPDALDSIFETLNSATYNISTRSVNYDGVGTISSGVNGYSGSLKVPTTDLTIVVPADGSVVVAYGNSSDITTYLDGVVEGITIEFANLDTLTVTVDGTVTEVPEVDFATGDVVTLSISNGIVNVDNVTQTTFYTSIVGTTIQTLPTATVLAVKDVTAPSSLTVY